MHKLRQLKLLVLYLISKKARDPLQPVVARYLITPFDVDATRALSHAYVGFAGLGRWQYSFHNINWKKLFSEKLVPLTQTEIVRYRRAAKLFTTVEVVTTLIWWDEKMAYFEHRIMHGSAISAIVYSTGTFFSGKERLPPNQYIVGLPPLPRTSAPEIIGILDIADKYFRSIEKPITTGPQ